ncbi:MAG: hypothetical protein WC756_04940 [Taibaiella sp.]|jgi:hypothetical protein
MKIIKTFEQYQEDWKRAAVYKPKTAVEEEKDKERVDQQKENEDEKKDQEKI